MGDKIRDIRSPEDWQDTGQDIHQTDDWADNVPREGLEEEARRRSFAAPINVETTFGGVRVPGSSGIQGQLSRTVGERDALWMRKQEREPCFLCVHFDSQAFTRPEKFQLLQALIKEHGWSPDMVEMDLGTLDGWGYCRVYKTLNHPQASCPRHFKRRDDV